MRRVFIVSICNDTLPEVKGYLYCNSRIMQPRYRKAILAAYIIMLLLSFASAEAQTEQKSKSSSKQQYVFEGGAIQSQKFYVSSGSLDNATANARVEWQPTFRFEAWRKNQKPNDAFHYGFVFQALYLRWMNRLSEDLPLSPTQNNDSDFLAKKNDNVEITFQFHSLRATIKRLIEQNTFGNLRLGGSVFYRYAKLDIESKEKDESVYSVDDSIIVLLLHFHYEYLFESKQAFVFQGDFFPNPKSIRLGLYDLFLGFRFHHNMEAGLRFFFGGYSPKKEGRLNNEVFFTSIVFRFFF